MKFITASLKSQARSACSLCFSSPSGESNRVAAPDRKTKPTGHPSIEAKKEHCDDES